MFKKRKKKIFKASDACYSEYYYSDFDYLQSLFEFLKWPWKMSSNWRSRGEEE